MCEQRVQPPLWTVATVPVSVFLCGSQWHRLTAWLGCNGLLEVAGNWLQETTSLPAFLDTVIPNWPQNGPPTTLSTTLFCDCTCRRCARPGPAGQFEMRVGFVVYGAVGKAARTQLKKKETCWDGDAARYIHSMCTVYGTVRYNAKLLPTWVCICQSCGTRRMHIRTTAVDVVLHFTPLGRSMALSCESSKMALVDHSVQSDAQAADDEMGVVCHRPGLVLSSLPWRRRRRLFGTFWPAGICKSAERTSP